MRQYIKELDNYLKQCEEKGGFSGIESMLEFLWECYVGQNPVDDGRIREKDQPLQAVLNALSFEDANDLFGIIVDYMTAYQRAAFLEGIAVGARLERELKVSL